MRILVQIDGENICILLGFVTLHHFHQYDNLTKFCSNGQKVLTVPYRQLTWIKCGLYYLLLVSILTSQCWWWVEMVWVS